jgi:hypothetical protein
VLPPRRTGVARLEPFAAGPHDDPLGVAPSPDGPFAAAVTPEILDATVAAQSADGSWAPHWTWDPFPPCDQNFAGQWPDAEAEWHSRLTLDMVTALVAWGKITT